MNCLWCTEPPPPAEEEGLEEKLKKKFIGVF